MTSASKFWGRMQEDVRTVSERARREAERAVRTGVLRVDLVSLRRGRNRANADLGARLLALWSEEKLGDLTQDPEALRLKALVQSIEEVMTAKEEELRAIRSRGSDEARTQ